MICWICKRDIMPIILEKDEKPLCTYCSLELPKYSQLRRDYIVKKMKRYLDEFPNANDQEIVHEIIASTANVTIRQAIYYMHQNEIQDLTYLARIVIEMQPEVEWFEL